MIGPNRLRERKRKEGRPAPLRRERPSVADHDAIVGALKEQIRCLEARVGELVAGAAPAPPAPSADEDPEGDKPKGKPRRRRG